MPTAAACCISSTLLFYTASQFLASLADYELDNFPQPIRMPFSGLHRPSQAQLQPHLKRLPMSALIRPTGRL